MVHQLRIDTARKPGKNVPKTHLLVNVDGLSVDIAQLDRDSLLTYLRSQGGLWTENHVLALLHHRQTVGTGRTTESDVLIAGARRAAELLAEVGEPAAAEFVQQLANRFELLITEAA